jgi:hypothetical protein
VRDVVRSVWQKVYFVGSVLAIGEISERLEWRRAAWDGEMQEMR